MLQEKPITHCWRMSKPFPPWPPLLQPSLSLSLFFTSLCHLFCLEGCHISLYFSLPQKVKSVPVQQQPRAVGHRHAATHHPWERHRVPAHPHHPLWQAAQGQGSTQIHKHMRTRKHVTDTCDATLMKMSPLDQSAQTCCLFQLKCYFLYSE